MVSVDLATGDRSVFSGCSMVDQDYDCVGTTIAGFFRDELPTLPSWVPSFAECFAVADEW